MELLTLILVVRFITKLVERRKRSRLTVTYEDYVRMLHLGLPVENVRFVRFTEADAARFRSMGLDRP